LASHPSSYHSIEKTRRELVLSPDEIDAAVDDAGAAVTDAASLDAGWFRNVDTLTGL
jgi:hypothetical protein